MKDVSVIIPSYKPGDYVWQCLDSFYCQTLERSRFEVIVVLNGCNEPWASMLGGWIADHPDFDIRLIQTDTPGVSNARNVGLDNAAGEYIAFVDDDDYVSPHYLEALLAVAAPDTVALSDVVAFYDCRRDRIDGYGPSRTFEVCSGGNLQSLYRARTLFNGPWMKLMSVKIIGNFRFDTALANGEDGLFVFQISRRIKSLAYVTDDAVYYRRFRDNSALTRQKTLWFWVSTALSVQIRYLWSWLKSPWSYNFLFFAARQVAVWKGTYYRITNRI